MSLWKPYQPTTDNPWDLKRVLHLHRRVVFGACWNEVQRDLKDEPQAAVTRVLNGTCRSEGVSPEFDNLAQTIGDAAANSGNPTRLKAWWVYRCLFSPRPLEERLTLMWHNHFATSNFKVKDLHLMQQQNETIRKNSFAPFGRLLHAMLQDSALLVWLDAPSNRAAKPNENLAREFLELFSLGVGNYSERDVSESARALTGLNVNQGKVLIVPENHDQGTKTILNLEGPWSGDDLVRLVLQQKSCARRIAWRLTSEFFGEGVVSEAALDELAEGLRQNQMETRWAVETILRSDLFFCDANIQTRIADPVSYLTIPLRAFECWRSPPSTFILAEWLDKIGQGLFYPPNVGGWKGGRDWLSTRTIIARANFATVISTGQVAHPPQPLRMPLGFSGIDRTSDKLVALSRLLCGGTESNITPQSIEASGALASSEAEILRHYTSQFLSCPAAQLH